MALSGKALLLFWPAWLLLAASEPRDFRGFDWKTPRSEVKKGETLPLAVEKPDYLGYASQFLGRSVLVIYSFERGRLVQGGYRFISDYADKNVYISEYLRLVSTLRKTLGRPDRETVSWKNPLFRKSPADWGLAVSVGHLVYQSIWQGGRSLVAVSLQGQEHQSLLSLDYVDGERAAQIFRRL